MTSEQVVLEEKFEKLSNYLVQDPDNLSLIVDCCNVAIELGKHDVARKLVSSGLHKYPDSESLLFQLATLEMSEGKISEAIELLTKLVDQGHDYAQVRYNLAYALGLVGKMPEAIQMLVNIDELSAELPQTQFLLAKLRHHNGELAEAISLCDSYLQGNPEDADACGYYALLLTDNEEFEKAKSYIESALKLQDNQYEALIACGMVQLSEGDVHKAQENFSKINHKPGQGRFSLGAGLCAMAEGKLDEAEVYLLQCVSSMNQHLGSWNALVWCQIAQGKLAQAETSINSALDINRNFGELHGTYAVINMLMQKYDEAEKNIRRAESLQPDSFALAYAKSLVAAHRGEQHDAQQLLENTLNQKISRDGKTVAESVQAMALKSKQYAEKADTANK